MNLENKITCSKTIINIHKIEQVINMWQRIKYLILDKNSSSQQIIDIPVDKTINWNYIKQQRNL